MSGLAGEFIQYFTTPEEYDRQHYEGGSTLYGPLSSNLLRQELAELPRRLVSGEPAQAAYPFEPTNGVTPDGPPYGAGAASGQVAEQPQGVLRRFERATFGWRGGPYGLDRPLGRAFVVVQRRVKRRWRTVDSDHPLAVRDVDLRHRPASARGGTVRFRVGGRTVEVQSAGPVFEVARSPGEPVSVPAGAARDRHGNRNGTALTLRVPPVTIHVVGAGGMLGRDVVRTAGERAVALTRAELDVTDRAAVQQALRGATVVNCAAYTQVDGAESEPEAAHAVNADGARNVAEAAERVLYVSTDYVFDGAKQEPYVESDPTGPLQEYGHSKLAGERATAEANENHLVVRSSWLFGAGGRNFVDTMLTLGREHEELLVVDDQVGSPTFTGHLAEALVALAGGGKRGVLHVAGTGSCSWFEFARAIFERAGLDAEVRPCATDEFPRPARRPANSVLASERGAPALPAWQDGLEAYLGVRA